MSTLLADRVERVRRQIAFAALRSGRNANEVELIAVSKKHPASAIDEGWAAGLTSFGENFVQEMLAKQDQVAVPDKVRWHYIGRLQRNKVKSIVGRTCLIHAVDRIELAVEIDRRARTAGIRQAVLIAVNVAGEASKSGVAPHEMPGLLEDLRRLSSVECAGLMTMPPLADDAEQSRPFFRALRTLRDEWKGQGLDLARLSMGTTHDFEIAIEEGATMVRVGTAIFGLRST